MHNKIYLDSSNEEYGIFEDINMGLISWSDNRMNASDITYIRREFVVNYLLARIKEIDAEIKLTNEMLGETMKAGTLLNRLRGQKKELKRLIDEI